MTIDSVPPSRADEIGLLDLVVTIAESWKLLVFGPLAIAILAYVALSLLPKEFEASAVVRLTADQVELVRAPKSIDALLAAAGVTLADEPGRTAARAEMSRRIGMSPWNEETREVTLAISGPSAQDAQSLLEALITEVRSSDVAVTASDESGHLDVELDAFREHSKVLRGALAALNAKQSNGGTAADAAPTAPESYARALSYLADQIRLSEVRVAYIERSRAAPERLARPELAPVPQVRRTSSRPATVAVLAFLATFTLLLIFVFARDAIRKEMRNPESVGKVERIRDALWRSRRTRA